MSYEVDCSCVEHDPIKRQALIDQAGRVVMNALKRRYLEEIERDTNSTGKDH